MDLTPSNIVAYLVERGIVPAEEAGGLVVNPSIRRNRNFKILRPEHRGYFVKQAKERDGSKTLSREALCYRRASEDPQLAALARLLPRFVAYDPANHVLIVELVRGSETLHDHFLRARAFRPEVGDLLADGLATYQSEHGRRLRGEVDDEIFPGTLPWLLTAAREPAWFRGWFGDPGADLLVWLSGFTEFTDAVDRMSRRWRRDTLLHGDLKWENCLLVGEGSDLDLRLVDWELADVGDARWELGGIIAAFLCSWTSWAPCGITLDSVRPAIQSFWRGYLRARAIPVEQERPLLELAIECAGLRAAQCALEAIYGATEIHATATAIAELALRLLGAARGSIIAQLGLTSQVPRPHPHPPDPPAVYAATGS